MVNIVAPWARELSAPSATYLPRYFMGDPKPGEKFHVDVAPGYDFDRLWSLFSQTIQTCLERAKAYGMNFSIENHTHTMMPVTDSFLRLLWVDNTPSIEESTTCSSRVIPCCAGFSRAARAV